MSSSAMTMAYPPGQQQQTAAAPPASAAGAAGRRKKRKAAAAAAAATAAQYGRGRGGAGSGTASTAPSLGPDERTGSPAVTEQSEEDGYVTRCICQLSHNDDFMISCDKCDVWQHADCMEVSRDNPPEHYYCERCQPRIVNPNRARLLQEEKLKNINDSSDDEASQLPPAQPVVR